MKTLSKISFLLLLSLFFVQCSNDELDDDMSIEEMEELEMEETINFSKSDSADPTSASSQDRITDNVWITRANNGGQIFNAKVEDSSSKSTSPTGTRWALGVASDKDNLDFQSFRETIKPKEVVGKNLVMHLVEDDIYINVKFTSWSQGGQNADAGGFDYTRTKLE